MTLNLLLAQSRPSQGTVILADPSDAMVEAVLAGLIPQLGAVERIMFPARDDARPPDRSPPMLVRRKYADLWRGLSAHERDHTLLVAGPTAAYLAPLIGRAVTALVVVRDPRAAIVPSGGSWPALLGPFPELDRAPAEPASEKVRETWRNRVRGATSPLRLVRDCSPGEITSLIGVAVGLGPKRAARAASVADSADADTSRRPDRTVHWLDELLYSLGASPDEQISSEAAKRAQAGRNGPKREKRARRKNARPGDGRRSGASGDKGRRRKSDDAPPEQL